jgi:hypothetical protein
MSLFSETVYFKTRRELDDFKKLMNQARELNVKVCSDALVDFKKAREEVQEVKEEGVKE